MNMEFLKPLFDEELNSEGDIIEIAGSVFERSKILNGLEPQTYQLAFDDWLTDKQERLLEKATEILELHDNKGRFEHLIRTLKAGNLVPFIGAGLSIPSGYPSWTAFLYQCCNESSIQEEELKGRFSLYVLANTFIPPNNHDFASLRRCSFTRNHAK